MTEITLADKIEALDPQYIEGMARRILQRAIILRDLTGASMRKAEAQGVCDVGVAVDAIVEALHAPMILRALRERDQVVEALREIGGSNDSAWQAQRARQTLASIEAGEWK